MSVACFGVALKEGSIGEVRGVGGGHANACVASGRRYESGQAKRGPRRNQFKIRAQANHTPHQPARFARCRWVWGR